MTPLHPFLSAALFALVASEGVLPLAATARADDAEVLAITEELLHAIERGDPAPWDTHLARSALFIQRDGTVYERDDLVKEIAPLPKGFRVALKIEDPRITRSGDSVIVAYRAVEHEEVFDQVIDTEYRSTYHYVKEDGAWKVLLFQYLEIPFDPPATRLSARELDALAGEYALGPEIRATITRDGDHLVMRRGTAAPVVLRSIDANRFFIPGEEGERVFERRNGKVTGFVHRRNWKDLRWTRVG